MILMKMLLIRSKKKWNKRIQKCLLLENQYMRTILGQTSLQINNQAKLIRSQRHRACQCHRLLIFKKIMTVSVKWMTTLWIPWLIWWNRIHKWWENNMRGTVAKKWLMSSGTTWWEWWILKWSKWPQTWWKPIQRWCRKPKKCNLKELVNQLWISQCQLRRAKQMKNKNLDHHQELEQLMILSLKK